MNNLTPWYPEDVKPVHVGVYQTRPQAGTVRYQHWNGSRWGAYSYRPSTAFNNRKTRSAYQFVKWRGLAQDPNA